MRTIAALVMTGMVVGVGSPFASAQPRANPPSASQLRALNMSLEWTTAIPVSGQRDSVALVQVVDTHQIFAQTRAGVLVAMDATTGAQQWVAHYESSYAPIIPVAVNDKYVFAINVVRLYCFQRYTGVLEFSYNLPLSPQAAPAVDDTHIYIPIGSGRMASLELPPPITMPDRALLKKGDFGSVLDPKQSNPADVVARRYPSDARRSFYDIEEFDQSRIDLNSQPGSGLGALQRTPSLSVLPTMVPPYRLVDNRGRYLTRVESLNTAASLRQPYRLQDPTAGNAQRTPSISVIPPSVARVYELASLLPRGVEPATTWVYGSTSRLVFTPLIGKQRVWMTTASPLLVAVLKTDKSPQVEAMMPDAPAAPAAQAEDIGFIPLHDGNLLAVRLDSGVRTTLRLAWRANVGGQMDKQPIPTIDGVICSGIQTGVVKVDRATGEVLWRTDPRHDTVLAVNKEHAYIWDRSEQIHVYDRLRASEPVTKRAYPLISVPMPGYTVPVTNQQTDRVMMASTTGLLVCMRDNAPAYVRPMKIAPPIHATPAAPVPVEARPEDPNSAP